MSVTRVAALIVAGGSGSRAERPGEPPKQYRPVAGRAVVAHTLARFLDHPAVERVVTVIHPDHLDHWVGATAGLAGLEPPVTGGASRQASVARGLEALAADPPDFVLIHDAARPFLPAAVIDRTLAALVDAPAVLVAIPVVDTLKKTTPDRRIVDTVSREAMWAAQTPQAFRFAEILAAHRAAAAAGRDDFTDDAGVAEWAGLPVVVVEGDRANLKLTSAEDIDEADRRMTLDSYATHPDVRAGTGYDVHAFEPGDAVTLCGVRIPHTAKLNGHSDADVALHALTDAILGTLGDGDIGAHFPPSDLQWRGRDSAVFVADALARLAARGGLLAHADVTIVAEAPKIGPHREAMRARLAEICGVALDRVAVKATTNEKLGFVGRREGIAALATVTVRLPLAP